MDIQHSVDFIRQKIGNRTPRIAIMLGSGLGEIAESADDKFELSYTDVEGFPEPTVEGHEGKLVFGRIKNHDVLFLKGRVHAYETDDFTAYKQLIRTVKALGVECLFTTSASGSLHDDMPPGSIMLIRDHINLSGINPLLGHNDDIHGPRFLAMNDAWSRDIRETIKNVANDHNVILREGIYMGFRGPCFETPAEIKMARMLGGDAIGMSAIPENVIANHCGLKVAGCAVITNFGAGMLEETLSHAQTLNGAKLAYSNLSVLINAFIENYNAQ